MYKFFTAELRLLLLFLADSWIFTNLFKSAQMYSEISKFRVFCSKSELVYLDDCDHRGFVCPFLLTERSVSCVQSNLNIDRRSFGFNFKLDFDFDNICFCSNQNIITCGYLPLILLSLARCIAWYWEKQTN